MSFALCVLLLLPLEVGQMPGHPPWKVMCKESTLIVTGVAERGVLVVHPDRMGTVTKPLPDGREIVELPNPANYVVGSTYTIQVEELIKKSRRFGNSHKISVFVAGFMTTDIPVIVEGERYVLFLRPLTPEDERFEGTITYKGGTTPDRNAKFDPKLCYGIVHDVVRISSDNMELIREIKAAMAPDN